MICSIIFDLSLISGSFSLALLHFLQRLHCAVQSMSVVSSEFGVCALQGRISVCLWLLDAAG